MAIGDLTLAQRDSATTHATRTVPSVPGNVLAFGANGLPMSDSPLIVKVTTQADLVAAMAAGKWIHVMGPITLDAPLQFAVEGTHVWSGAGVRGKLIRDGAAATERNVAVVTAPRCGMHGLEVTMNNTALAPLTLNTDETLAAGNRLDYAIWLRPDVGDCSDFVLEECYIHNVTIAVYVAAGAGKWVDRARIVNNRIESFNYHGIYFSAASRKLTITDNWISGRARNEGKAGANETHAVAGNGIWVGTYAQKLRIANNDIGNLDRHGVEVLNIGDAPGSNDPFMVTENFIHDLVPPAGTARVANAHPSMGISVSSGGSAVVIANNVVDGTSWYGLEAVHPVNATTRYLITGNVFKNVVGTNLSAAGSRGISINSCTGVLCVGNWIEKISMAEDGSTAPAEGIEVAPSSAPAHSTWAAFDGVIIRDNVLVDFGNFGVSVAANAGETKTRRNTIVSGNVFRYTTGRWRRTSWPETAVWAANAGPTSVVRDNIFMFPASLPPSGAYPGGSPSWVHMNGFDLIGTGTVCNGDAYSAAITGAASVQLDICGTNLTIPY